MVWINEVDSARNMDELKWSSSVLGRMFPDFDQLDSKIASTLKKLLTTRLKRRVHMEEQEAQQDNGFLNGNKWLT